MVVFGSLLFLASLVMIVISIVVIITKAVGKNSWENKKIGILSGASFGLFVLSIIIVGAFSPPADPNRHTAVTVSQTGSNQSNPPNTNPADPSSQSYNAGLAAFNQNNFLSALPLFQAVDAKSPNYADAQAKIGECNKNLAAQLVADAKRCVNEKLFDAALTQLNAALTYNPDSNAKAMIPDVQKQKQAWAEEEKARLMKAYKDSCQTISYKVLNKNPDGHKGEKVKLRGEIMQIQESDGQTFMLLSVTNLGYNIWTDNVAVAYLGKIDAYEKDVITVWGNVTGSYSYKSRAGWDITIPGVLALYAE